MIEANELRIGNLVYPDKTQNGVKTSREVLLRIESINGEVVMAIAARKEIEEYAIPFEINLGEIKPIPLTEELIEKFNSIEKTEVYMYSQSYFLEIGGNKRLHIIVEKGNQHIVLQDYNKNDPRITTDAICIYNDDKNSELSVHKFQNIVYALTGEDLTINL